jgi:hypothetical protein
LFTAGHVYHKKGLRPLLKINMSRPLYEAKATDSRGRIEK